MKNKKLILALLIVIVLCCLITFCFATLILFSNTEESSDPVIDKIFNDSGEDTNKGSITSDGNGLPDIYNTNQVSFIRFERTTDNPKSYNNVKLESSAIDISNRETPEVEIQHITLNHILLFKESLDALVKSDWESGDDFNISYQELALSGGELEEIAQIEEIKKEERNVPAELDELLKSTSSISEIEKLINTSYQEYLSFLEAKNVSNEYISEMQKVVSPERLYYLADDADEQYPSSTHAVGGEAAADFSIRQIDITVGSIFTDMKIIINSRVLGEYPSSSEEQVLYYTEARDMAVRLSMYHEMTHVLQRAYMQVHTPDSQIFEKNLHTVAKASLAELDSENSWKWSKYTNPNIIQAEEATRTQEQQAEGIAFEVLTNVYQMNDKQKDALWTHWFGRIDGSKEMLLQIKDIFNNDLVNTSYKLGLASDLANAIFSNYPGETGVTLRKTLRGASGIDADAGYLDPIRPEETAEFWNKLN